MSPLGIYDQTGDPVEQGLLDKIHTETGLSGPGHADDDSVCREVAGGIDDRLVRLEIPTQIEVAMVQLHGGKVPSREPRARL
jgi:hypothetical protein